MDEVQRMAVQQEVVTAIIPSINHGLGFIDTPTPAGVQLFPHLRLISDGLERIGKVVILMRLNQMEMSVSDLSEGSKDSNLTLHRFDGHHGV